MSLVKMIVPLALIGAGLWGVNTYLPMTNTVKAVVNAVLVALISLWLLYTLGVIDSVKGLSPK